MASVRKTKLSPYWQAVLTIKNGVRTNRSTKQTDKQKAKEVADEMQRTINATRHGAVSRDKLWQIFNDLMVRVGENQLTELLTPSASPRPKKARLPSLASRKTENDMLAELRRRLGRG